MKTNSIINWELHQKLMEKRKTIRVCTGIGANMFFPEYVEVEIYPEEKDIINELPEDLKKPKRGKSTEKSNS